MANGEKDREKKIKKTCEISKKLWKQNTQTNKLIISTMSKETNLYEIRDFDEVTKKLRQYKSLCKLQRNQKRDV